MKRIVFPDLIPLQWSQTLQTRPFRCLWLTANVADFRTWCIFHLVGNFFTVSWHGPEWCRVGEGINHYMLFGSFRHMHSFYLYILLERIGFKPRMYVSERVTQFIFFSHWTWTFTTAHTTFFFTVSASVFMMFCNALPRIKFCCNVVNSRTNHPKYEQKRIKGLCTA